MKLSKHAEGAAKDVTSHLKITPGKKQMDQIARIIEKAIVEAVVEHRTKCADVVVKAGSEDTDLAHAIRDKIRRKTDVLIANLSAMR